MQLYQLEQLKSKWKKQLLVAGLVALPMLAYASDAPGTPPVAIKSVPTDPKGEYLLSDFGDVTNIKTLQQLVDAACTAIVAKGGGILIVPPGAAADVQLENNSQTQRESGLDVKAAVTINDRRGGYDNVIVPTIGKWTPNGWMGQGQRRTYNFQGPGAGPWGISSATGIENRIVHGTSSYLHPTVLGAPAGKDSKVYLRTVRGIFTGQFLNFYFGPAYAGGYETIVVKTIGWDPERKLSYLTADLTKEHLDGAHLSNKNMVGGVQIDSSLNADQQTGGEFGLVRKQYANGDSFLISAIYCYQGDQITQLGDEGGVVYNAEVAQDADPFNSVVESVDWSKDSLTFKPGQSNVEKLASSRHLINMNDKKWISAGTVKIVGSDDWSGMILNAPGFDSADVIKNGLDMTKFKFTRPAKAGEDLSVYDTGGNKVHPDTATGKVLVPTLKTWMGVPVKKLKHVYQGRSYPTLINGYNWMGGRIIASADCGWTPDIVGRYFAVADEGETLAQTDKTQGSAYMAGEVSRKIYRWYPIIGFWKNADGTCGIRLGRERMFASGAGAPNLYNEDNYTWDGHERPLKYVIAPGAMVYDVSQGYKDSYGGTTTAADPRTIKITDGPYRKTAFDFAPGDRIEQSIGADPVLPTPFRVRLWNNIPDNFGSDGTGAYSVVNYGRVAAASAFSLHGGISDVNNLNMRKDRKAPFLKGVDIGCLTGDAIRFGADVSNAALFFAQPNGHMQPIKWVTDAGETSLVVDPASGDMRVRGSSLDVPKVKGVGGLSATAVNANNLRGINSLVPNGKKTVTIRFVKPEPNDAYSINVQPNWLTRDAVTQKTVAGFTVVFSDAPGPGARLDWQLIR